MKFTIQKYRISMDQRLKVNSFFPESIVKHLSFAWDPWIYSAISESVPAGYMNMGRPGIFKMFKLHSESALTLDSLARAISEDAEFFNPETAEFVAYQLDKKYEFERDDLSASQSTRVTPRELRKLEKLVRTYSKQQNKPTPNHTNI